MTLVKTSRTILGFLASVPVTVAMVWIFDSQPVVSFPVAPLQEKRILPQASPVVSEFYPQLQKYVQVAAASFDGIPSDRREDLGKIADYVYAQLSKSEPAKLIFICTHNSRRSHLTQIWAQVAADVYGLSGVETYSGGTDATAFNPRTVAALQRCGLNIKTEDNSSTNPQYEVLTSDSAKPQLCFSKVYSAPPNPTESFCAVMTCSEADQACPLVKGCDLRAPLRYEDPKVADDTEFESQRYDERSKQICIEMLYMMSLVKDKLE